MSVDLKTIFYSKEIVFKFSYMRQHFFKSTFRTTKAEIQRPVQDIAIYAESHSREQQIKE